MGPQASMSILPSWYKSSRTCAHECAAHRPRPRRRKLEAIRNGKVRRIENHTASFHSWRLIDSLVFREPLWRKTAGPRFDSLGLRGSR